MNSEDESDDYIDIEVFQKYKDKMEQRLASHESKMQNLQKTNIEIIQQNMKLLTKID